MKSKRPIVLAAASFLILFGIVGAGFGIAELRSNSTERDASGYFTTPTEVFRTSGHALVSTVDLGSEASPDGWMPFEHFGRARLRVVLEDNSDAFVGIAKSADAWTYLSNVAHNELSNVTLFPFRATNRFHAGSTVPVRPSSPQIWSVQSSGHGVQVLNWKVQPGTWSMVVMHADASPKFVADISVGVDVDWIEQIGIALLIVSALLVLAGALIVASQYSKALNSSD